MKKFGFLFLFLMTLSGCGNGNDVPFDETVPASGTATYQGKPLEGYRIYLSNSENRTATANIGSDGRFVLGTNNPEDGAPTGTHRIWFSYEPEVAVEAGKEDQVKIPPPKVKLPSKYLNPAESGLTVEVPEAGLTDYKLELE